ncbi:biotin biosynthesis protein BioC [Falsiruegeria litorea R37]|uniref:Biotin biosynthesis protein BioC n=1 Tax=Falsiruegeria litorea R37 TaxID=1200284 RepID=A0A1Y5RSV6_9RHOB|nr:class I SAM-dependent methyltransferase [Falsiruegeria litorea]SLN21910.1 biotin biosynthesis protein BioC [Falsiruegeria litorea R37]
MSDKQTLDVYAEAAQQYADGYARAKDADQKSDLRGFLELIPEGGYVLDLGCGPGHWAARFKAEGLQVDATDASPAMVALAKSDFGVDARVESFDQMAAVGIYDGIWANFSLLHAPREDFPTHLARIHRALKPGGAFHIGMKLGSDQGRDSLGRFYSYFSEDELREHLKTAGFTVTRSKRGNGEGLAGGVETFVTMTTHA